MKRAVLDEAVPADAAVLFLDKEIEIAGFPDEWRSLPDSKVLERASATGFDWLITCDKQMPFQQNLAGKAISVLVLPSPQLQLLEALKLPITHLLRSPLRGHFVHVDQSGRQIGRPAPHLQGPKA